MNLGARLRISVLFNFPGDSRKYAMKFVAKVFLMI